MSLYSCISNITVRCLYIKKNAHLFWFFYKSVIQISNSLASAINRLLAVSGFCGMRISIAMVGSLFFHGDAADTRARADRFRGERETVRQNEAACLKAIRWRVVVTGTRLRRVPVSALPGCRPHICTGRRLVPRSQHLKIDLLTMFTSTCLELASWTLSPNSETRLAFLMLAMVI